MRFPSVLLYLSTSLAMLPFPVAAIEDPAAKIEALESRIAQLEEQNRQILELLKALGAEQPAAPVAAPPEVAATTEVPVPRQVQAGKSKLSFYGFIRLDAIYDDSRPSSIQSPTFILSEDPAVGSENEDSFNFHPRLTRFGMNYEGSKIGGTGPQLSGKIEVDFQNGGRESRQVPRMRHGYLNLAWDDSSLLIGQTWDVISPLYPTVNSDTLMWNAGNLGDRRPQIRYGKTHKSAHGTVSFLGGIGLTGAIDSQDLDGDGVRDGDAAALPNLQSRLGFSGSNRSGNWGFGVWGHYGQEELQSPLAGEDRFDTYSVGLDYQVSLSSRLTLKGELWTGSNLSDFRGGAGQGINRGTGREIDSSGGWVELGVKVSDRYSLYGGVTLDDPKDEDLAAGGIRRNGSTYLVNRWSFGKEFLLGLDYLRWKTEFVGLDDGTDNRLNLYVVYNF